LAPERKAEKCTNKENTQCLILLSHRWTDHGNYSHWGWDMNIIICFLLEVANEHQHSGRTGETGLLVQVVASAIDAHLLEQAHI
jgi:hypothetical protein